MNEQQARDHIAAHITKESVTTKHGTYWRVVNRFLAAEGRVTDHIATEAEAVALRDSLRAAELIAAAGRVA